MNELDEIDEIDADQVTELQERRRIRSGLECGISLTDR
jgi:hypothetical protein